MKAIKSSALTLLGAAAGGAVGYFLFFWLASMGFYGLAVPGGLIGLGAGYFKNRSVAVAVVCGLAALALSLFIEWKFAPFAVDDSLGYFLAHFYQLTPVTLVMIVLGTAIAFWIPFPRRANTPVKHAADDVQKYI